MSHKGGVPQKIPQTYTEYVGNCGGRERVYAWPLIWPCGCTEYQFVA